VAWYTDITKVYLIAMGKRCHGTRLNVILFTNKEKDRLASPDLH